MSVLDVVLVTLIVLAAGVFIVRRFVGTKKQKPSKAVLGGKLAKAMKDSDER